MAEPRNKRANYDDYDDNDLPPPPPAPSTATYSTWYTSTLEDETSSESNSPPINPGIPVATPDPITNPTHHTTTPTATTVPHTTTPTPTILTNPWISANLTQIKAIWDTCTPLTCFDEYEQSMQVAILEFTLAIYQNRHNPAAVQQPLNVGTPYIRNFFMVCVATNEW